MFCSRGNGSNKEYPAHWVMFSPDVVIDANTGNMWHLVLKMKPMASENNGGLPVKELPRLTGFLLQREGSKMVLLDTLLDWCSHPKTDLGSIGTKGHFERSSHGTLLLVSSVFGGIRTDISMSVLTAFHVYNFDCSQ